MRELAVPRWLRVMYEQFAKCFNYFFCYIHLSLPGGREERYGNVAHTV